MSVYRKSEITNPKPEVDDLWKDQSQISNLKPLIMDYAERNGGLKGQHALSPGQRPGYLNRPVLFRPERA